MRLLFIILLFATQRFWAQQNPVIDSLTAILQQVKSDKEKAEILAKLSAAYKNVNSEKAMILAEEGISLAHKIKDTASEVMCNIQIALIERERGKFAASLTRLKENLKKVQNTKYYNALSSCYITIGDVYSVLENYDKAIQYYDQAIILNRKDYNREDLVTAINRKANRYMDKGRMKNDTLSFYKAISLYQNAISESPSTTPTRWSINTVVCLADAYNILGQYTHNKSHLFKSLNYSMYSLKLARQIYSKEYQGISYMNLGEVYMSLNQEMKAIHYFDLAAKTYSEIGNKGWLVNANYFLAKSYVAIHLYDQAIVYVKRSIKLAHDQKAIHYLKNNYFLLSEIYQKQGKNDLALESFKLYNAYKDSVLNETSFLNISKLQAELDLTRKDNEIALLTKNTELQKQQLESQKIQQNYLISGIIVLIIILVALLFLFNERRKGMNEILKAKNQAEKAKEAQEQFLANTSHEIRTPMNGIIGMTNHLIETNLTSQQREFVSVIKESSNTLLTLINEILDLSKIIAKKIVFDNAPFEIREVVKGIVRLLEFRTKQKNIKIIVNIDEDIPNTLNGDAVRLKQILLNLLENAVKFTNQGHVKIQVSILKKTDSFFDLQFMVEDTGIGIPENKLSDIFENFTQVNSKTTRKYSGTGLGLAITKQLIEQQGGTINVVSKLNLGSKFSFNIKFDTGHYQNKFSSLSSSAFSIIPNADLSNCHILVVDDNKINQQVAALTLEKWKASVKLASSAQEAFELLKKHDFDLILMDVTMPDIDGFEATRKIRSFEDKKISSLPIIAITAAAFMDDKNKCIAAGMNDYISKPFNPADLLDKLTHLLPKIVKPYSANKVSDLSMLQHRAAGDMVFMKEILESYIQEMPLYIAEMELFLDKKDWQEVSKQAHKMKSPIALMGAMQLKELFSKIEVDASLNRDQDELVKQIRLAQKQCLETVNELKIELDKIKV